MATKTKSTNTRIRKLDYRSKKRAVRVNEPIAGSFRLFRRTLLHLWQNKRVFGLLLIVYLGLYMLFVKGLATNFQLGETRAALEEASGGELGTWETGAALFGTLIGASGSTTSDAAGVYQTLLFIIMPLSIIWVLRQTFGTRKSLTLSDALYNSTQPLIPYLLVWLVVLVQLLPALIGTFLYSIVVSNGIAVGTVEQVLWLVFLLALIGVSVFFVSSSLFATYIVTLPGMRPMTALKKARSLVKFRRFLIIRRLIVLPMILLVLMIVVFFPLVLYAAAVAEVLFMVVSLLLLFILHTYMYLLYREMMS